MSSARTYSFNHLFIELAKFPVAENPELKKKQYNNLSNNNRYERNILGDIFSNCSKLYILLLIS